MTATEAFYLASSIVSVLLGLLSIVLSLVFFAAAKSTERSVDGTLIKIQTQTEMLQKITGRQLDRLTKFVTERPSESNEFVPQMLDVLSRLPQALTGSLMPQTSPQPPKELLDE